MAEKEIDDEIELSAETDTGAEAATKKDERQKPDKYFADQFDDEEVLFVFRRHPIAMRKGLIFGMLAWLVGPLITLILTYVRPESPPTIAFFGLALVGSILLGIIIMIPSWIGWYFSVFIVTDQRFIQITQKGLFHRAVADLGLGQIQSVNYEVAGLQETMLGFGTIKMQTYVGDLVIREVHKPARIQKHILRILRDEGVATKAYPGGSAKRANQANEETEEAQEA